MTFESSSSAATKKFGATIAAELLARGPRRHAIVVGLVGALGGGKTTFVQGFFRAAGARGRAVSPTFVIMRRAALRRAGFRDLYHLDAYRLASATDLAALGFKELLRDPANILLIEWADRIRRALPKDTLWLTFAHGRTMKERMVVRSGKRS